VFPFVRFPGVDTILGPEMKSTGEVMGGGETFGIAFAKAQLAAGQRLPDQGRAFISVNDDDKRNVVPIARDLAELGFELVASRGTAAYLRAHGLDVEVVYKINEGRPHVGDRLVDRQIDLIVNTPLGRESYFDDLTMRRVAMLYGIPCVTTLTGAAAAVSAIRALRSEKPSVRPLQVITEGMTDVVHKAYGTGQQARVPQVRVAGKTGTAQVITGRGGSSQEIARRFRDHAWFVAFAPADAPKIAVACLLEHAAYGGGKAAAPVVQKVLSAYFSLVQQRREGSGVRPAAYHPF
jgi:hypothetical protein